MGSDVGQIFLTVSLHRDHSILYALVCEKESSHMGKNNGNPNLVCENHILTHEVSPSLGTKICNNTGSIWTGIVLQLDVL